MQSLNEQVEPMGSRVRRNAARHAVAVTVLACSFAYGLVTMTFLGALPYPPMEAATVDALAHVIATINALALGAILRGWWLVRNGRFLAHRRMMTTAFGLILLFLLIYLFKVGGGGVRVFTGPEVIRSFVYLPVLFAHLGLSILSVPLVVHALVLALSRPIVDVPASHHARIGRWAAGSWSTSLMLGILAYAMLNHL